MAGAGYKLFQTGDVLTAAQVNTYLNEQTVMVFASSAARTSALTSVLAEGMVSYLQDTNAVEVYDGSAWVSIGASGDITGVTAGTGISGGGTSGTVTITNSMATEITAAGDIIVGTGSGTFDNLPIGTTGQVLTADTTVSPYKVKWASAASGGMTSLASASFSTSTNAVTISSIDGSYNELLIHVDGWRAASDDTLRVRVNGVSSSVSFANASVNISNQAFDGGGCEVSPAQDSGAANGFTRILIPNYSKTSWKVVDAISLTNNETTNTKANMTRTIGGLNVTSAVTSVTLYTGNGSNFGAGSYTIYGVK